MDGRLARKAAIILNWERSDEFDGDRDVSMVAANGENLRKRYDNGDTWYEFGMGAQVQLSRNTHFYGDIERSFGGDTKKEWQVNTGIRWEF